MKVLVAKEFLGTDNHIIYDGSTYAWVSKQPKDAWTYGSKSSDLDIGFIAKTVPDFSDPFLNSSYANSFVQVGDRDAKIPWCKVMPRHAFVESLQDLLDQLWFVITDDSNSYYREHLSSYYDILRQLGSPIIDKPVAIDIIKDERIGVASEISKFLPRTGGSAPRTVYSLTGSLTGRATVVSGPNILTLKKQNRKIFKSRYKDGKIIQIDISSLEPRIALSIFGREAPDDIYSFICDELFGGKLERKHAKIAILSCIYGASKWTLSEKLPDSVDTSKVMSEIKRYFGIEKLSRSLRKESESGFIRNVFGRKIESSKSHVNHYLQSSGVDVSFKIFRQVLDDMRGTGEDFTPLYVIHDAIVLDVSPGGYESARLVASKKFKVEGLSCSFPTSLEVIKE